VRASTQGRWVVWARRLTQIAFLVLFLGLIRATWADPAHEPTGWLGVFFDLDPLVWLGNALAARSVAGLSALVLITVVVTLLLGRVFCGWFCPFGTLHHAVSWLRRRVRRYPRGADAFSPWQRMKYLLLVGFLVMSLFGIQWVGMLDPFALMTRSVVTAAWPDAQYATEETATAIYHADPHVGPLHLTDVSEPTYRFLRDHVFVAPRQAFHQGAVIFALFAAALIANLYRPRLWCRYLCPLGALLGLCSRRPGLQLANDDASCNGCRKCSTRCPAAAQPDLPGEWLPSECFGCWTCVAACERDSIRFVPAFPLVTRPAAGTLDLRRRSVLTAAGLGAGGALLLRSTPVARGDTYVPQLIRPPGARAEEEFLDRCVQCGLCMKICPTNALHPAGLEGGLNALWSPKLIARIGYCEWDCNRCGEVCPTQAIEPLPLEEKKKFKIGLAYIDTTRCLPYAYGRECIVCEEHCPIPDKAIYFVRNTITLRDGTTRTLRQPKVDPNLCTGCGICETKCPFKDVAAIRVTSANESRHLDNQPILPGSSPTDPAAGAYGGYGG
jgi:MauM/NapG family ferredoxin protein